MILASIGGWIVAILVLAALGIAFLIKKVFEIFKPGDD